jgi:uncharacterized phage infection (PIP) family protein YhgE
MNKFELLEIKSKSVADLAGEAAKLLATLEADEFWSETLLTNSEISDGFQTLFDATTKLITGLDECIPGLQQTIEAMSKILESFQTARGEIGKLPKKSPGLN